MLTGCVPWPDEPAQRYRQEGIWRGEVLGDLLRPWAARDPDRTAVVTRHGRHSYAGLDNRADRLAAGLVALGIGPGDRVVVQLPNTPDFVVTCVALFRVGALPVLALPAHRRAELGYLAEYAGAAALVVPDVLAGTDHRDLARAVRQAVPGLKHVLVAGEAQELTALRDVDAEPLELPAPDPSEVAFFLLSGGTTGLPKLIPRTHDDYAFQLRATAEAMGFDEHGAYLAALPVAHNAALGCPGVLGALRAGGRAVLAASPAPDEVFPLITAEQVTLTTLMPALLPVWTETAAVFGADLSKLVIEVGGATLSPEVARRVRPATGATLTHWFGMAEGVLCFTRPGDGDEVAATTQGTPLSPADELRVVDEADRDVPAGKVGELLARGPCTLRGYYAVPEHNRTVFTADGFLRTGDLVRRDAAGRLVVVGRIKDVVNRGGEKISVDEVEAHLVAHPAVRTAAVVPVPDPRLGEKTCAVIVARDAPPSLAEVHDFLRARGLADFKLPDRLHVTPQLPYTPVGKIDRRALAREVVA
ncbi:2,3-dihydroxybenzoate-AMP ligase [Micromonospora phaseoli]|uniref:2,3-dihydroxybenzoate-AMP ligase n=1 Tax=Micromonospora phaseoli TaxID=1144548 RepID=A0A1H6YDF4_9ACTN|nr:AMP-binding protein [Micromonospora phaseoli]PZW00093.1 2,3-dihydroxybenzoate-AMP ligase [Micromonospora phaseoli]GIJ79603.1 2,3-dihydroxybenzoate-AMP ligase [Micromonospora phaseoli]SEJ37924.1 2,3-dihydroxybenzoate-AMP ligase [Micromonospora phaseoli]